MSKRDTESQLKAEPETDRRRKPGGDEGKAGNR